MMQLSAEARNLNWLVSNFVERVPGVKEATVVSSDGHSMIETGVDRSCRQVVKSDPLVRKNESTSARRYRASCSMNGRIRQAQFGPIPGKRYMLSMFDVPLAGFPAIWTAGGSLPLASW